MKNIIKKVTVNFIMGIVMILLGMCIATAMYTAGFKMTIPSIKITWSNENYDLQLIDKAADGETPRGVYTDAIASK